MKNSNDRRGDIPGTRCQLQHISQITSVATSGFVLLDTGAQVMSNIPGGLDVQIILHHFPRLYVLRQTQWMFSFSHPSVAQSISTPMIDLHQPRHSGWSPNPLRKAQLPHHWVRDDIVSSAAPQLPATFLLSFPLLSLPLPSFPLLSAPQLPSPLLPSQIPTPPQKLSGNTRTYIRIPAVYLKTPSGPLTL